MNNPRFIIGGASRAGKSVLAKRLHERFGGSWLLGDAIVSSLRDAFPSLGISHHGNLDDIADKFEACMKYLLWNYAYAGAGYVFDTTHLFPRHVVKMRQKTGDIPVVFLGYADTRIEEKMRDIRRYDPAQDWWTADLSDSELRDHVITHIEKSKKIKEECLKFDLTYIDTGRNFDAALLKAENILAEAVK